MARDLMERQDLSTDSGQRPCVTEPPEAGGGRGTLPPRSVALHKSGSGSGSQNGERTHVAALTHPVWGNMSWQPWTAKALGH